MFPTQQEEEWGSEFLRDVSEHEDHNWNGYTTVIGVVWLFSVVCFRKQKYVVPGLHHDGIARLRLVPIVLGFVLRSLHHSCWQLIAAAMRNAVVTNVMNACHDVRMRNALVTNVIVMRNAVLMMMMMMMMISCWWVDDVKNAVKVMMNCCSHRVPE